MKYYTDVQPGYVFNMDAQDWNRKFVIVTEGPFDAITISGVSILGSEINDIQRELIEGLNRQIIVVPDRDAPGEKLINQAIEFGSQLFDKLYENTDTEDLVLSETCYNLAVCYRYIGYELYNNVADVIQSATDDKELIKKTLDDAESAKEYLSIAKEKFFDASGFNPDDKTSSNYAKELSKVIKQLRKLFIPALEEKL